ncbi:MAG: hypothetical protein V1717_00150 [Candidatus Micrarchaeota archaeon]
MRFHLKSKGFIGPLGDDIPSIFPIVFAVLLFGGTVIYANQVISEKASALETREGAVSLSYLVTEKGFLSDAELEKICTEKIEARAASLKVRYLITLKRFCDGIPVDFTSSDPDLNPYGNGEKASPFYLDTSLVAGETWFYCSNSEEVETTGTGLFEQPKQSILLSFPVAVPCPNYDSFTSGLGVVNVITWK